MKTVLSGSGFALSHTSHPKMMTNLMTVSVKKVSIRQNAKGGLSRKAKKTGPSNDDPVLNGKIPILSPIPEVRPGPVCLQTSAALSCFHASDV